MPEAAGVRCAPPESAAEFSQLPSTKLSVPVTTNAYSPCCSIDSGSRGPPGQGWGLVRAGVIVKVWVRVQVRAGVRVGVGVRVRFRVRVKVRVRAKLTVLRHGLRGAQCAACEEPMAAVRRRDERARAD